MSRLRWAARLLAPAMLVLLMLNPFRNAYAGFAIFAVFAVSLNAWIRSVEVTLIDESHVWIWGGGIDECDDVDLISWVLLSGGVIALREPRRFPLLVSRIKPDVLDALERAGVRVIGGMSASQREAQARADDFFRHES